MAHPELDRLAVLASISAIPPHTVPQHCYFSKCGVVQKRDQAGNLVQKRLECKCTCLLQFSKAVSTAEKRPKYHVKALETTFVHSLTGVNAVLKYMQALTDPSITIYALPSTRASLKDLHAHVYWAQNKIYLRAQDAPKSPQQRLAALFNDPSPAIFQTPLVYYTYLFHTYLRPTDPSRNTHQFHSLSWTISSRLNRLEAHLTRLYAPVFTALPRLPSTFADGSQKWIWQSAYDKVATGEVWALGQRAVLASFAKIKQFGQDDGGEDRPGALDSVGGDLPPPPPLQ